MCFNKSRLPFSQISSITYGDVYIFTTKMKPCDCIKVTTKTANDCNKSSAMLCSQRIKQFGFATIGSRYVTANLLGGRNKNCH